MTLAEAAENGDIEQITRLLAAGADPNEEMDDDWPPLLNAAYADHVEAARLLLDAGADLYKPSRAGETSLSTAGQAGSIGVFRLLLERGYQFDSERDHGEEMLISAKHVEIVQFLLSHGVDVDTTDFQGCTALTYAAHSAELEIVEELIRAGADVNHRDHDGETVLMRVADTAGNADALRVLIDHGADVNALNAAVEPSAITDALSWTMWHGDCEMLQVLLDKGAKVGQSDALTRAAYNGFSSAVRLLLEHGADPAAPDCYGNFAPDHARRGGHQDIVQMLFEALQSRERAGS